MWVGGRRLAAASLPPGKTGYPLYRRLGGPRGWSGRVRKISSPTRIQSPDHLACSESLYRQIYPGSQILVRGCIKLTALCDAYRLCNPRNFFGKMGNFPLSPPTAGHPRHQQATSYYPVSLTCYLYTTFLAGLLLLPKLDNES